jgi:hypothetical protein
MGLLPRAKTAAQLRAMFVTDEVVTQDMMRDFIEASNNDEGTANSVYLATGTDLPFNASTTYEAPVNTGVRLRDGAVYEIASTMMSGTTGDDNSQCNGIVPCLFVDGVMVTRLWSPMAGSSGDINWTGTFRFQYRQSAHEDGKVSINIMTMGAGTPCELFQCHESNQNLDNLTAEVVTTELPFNRAVQRQVFNEGSLFELGFVNRHQAASGDPVAVTANCHLFFKVTERCSVAPMDEEV